VNRNPGQDFANFGIKPIKNLLLEEVGLSSDEIDIEPWNIPGFLLPHDP
jgi:hypothetical protein